MSTDHDVIIIGAGPGGYVAMSKPDGLVKVLCDPKTDELLGAHIVGHNATELLHELLLARSSELLPEDFANMIHAHPTISEAIMETMRGVNGRPIHA
jgi:dihydrolipoamide dehydrogenase